MYVSCNNPCWWIIRLVTVSTLATSGSGWRTSVVGLNPASAPASAWKVYGPEPLRRGRSWGSCRLQNPKVLGTLLYRAGELANQLPPSFKANARHFATREIPRIRATRRRSRGPGNSTKSKPGRVYRWSSFQRRRCAAVARGGPQDQPAGAAGGQLCRWPIAAAGQAPAPADAGAAHLRSGAGLRRPLRS